MNRRQLLRGAAALAAAGTAPAFATPVALPGSLNPAGIQTAGIRMIPVMEGRYKVWTKKVGSGNTKVLLLHGGPAFTHAYLEAFESFLPEAGIEMYYYDQLGCGNSDVPDDPALWTLQRFTAEVEEVRRGLGLDRFVLYGHSWGGILAIEYALQHQQHLSGLIISSMAASMSAYLARTSKIKNWLPPAKRALLQELEARNAYSDPAYERLMMEDLYPQVLCRLQPWPEPVTRSLRLANMSIYELMQGKSEFQVTGTLKDWDRWKDLVNIAVPTLTMGATYDEMDPQDMLRMAELLPHGTSHICPRGSHLSMWDDQADYFNGLLHFLKAIAPPIG